MDLSYPIGQKSVLIFLIFGTLWMLFTVFGKYSEYQIQAPFPPWQDHNPRYNLVQTKAISLMTINPAGRLGNQMYEYAALLGLANSSNRTPVLGSAFGYLHNTFKLSVNITLIPKVMRIFHESPFQFFQMTVDALKNINGDVKLIGYFQNHNYFKSIKEQLRKEFTFRDNIMRNVNKYFNDSGLSSVNITKIGMHIRRTDMLTKARIDMGFGPPDLSYFKNAMAYFRVKYGRVRFIICSDDIKWVQTYLNASDVTIVSGNSGSVDMAILASCDHVIVSNGTFSWWAGWLCLGTTVYYKRIPQKGTVAYVNTDGQYWPPDDKHNHYVPIDMTE